jgi:RimJ/RimL family protein N-acetyltransferase
VSTLDIFIPGETINLCIPTAAFARESAWYSWFNDTQTTRYLSQGAMPNTPYLQEHFLLTQKNDRLTLIICGRDSRPLGVTSLSSIDLIKKTCDVAIVVDVNSSKRMSPYISLEAIARVTEHGFNALGMEKISAGQHINLAGWQQRMELLGYRIEGIHRKKFVKGRERADTMSIGCTYEDFLEIYAHRGSLWDSMESMRRRIGRLPKEKFSLQLRSFIEKEGNAYYKNIFSL